MRELFFRHVAQTSSSPLALEIRRAEGVFLFDNKGDRYIDLVSGVSVSNVGHSNPEVIRAVSEQASNYMHLMVYGEIIESPQVIHAKMLTGIMPACLNKVYYVNSGSEANEAALKLAKRVTGRREIISCRNCYHGSTHGVLSIMGGEFFKNAYRPLLPETKLINFNSFEDLEYITGRSACVIIEPVQGEGGVIIPVDGYLHALRERCNQTGTLLIFDEVQTGFGRTGKMFAFEKFGVIPDMITLAKALGGGMPLGALVADGRLLDQFTFDPPLGHITTFGGHPVSCAAAVASLNLLLKENWIVEAEEKGRRFAEALIGHKTVKEIRQCGLLIAVELQTEEQASKILELLLNEKIMSDWFLFNERSFRIAPPLCIDFKEIELACERILIALDNLCKD
jgi:acetylornithine/succinyldiaminopimelate/putrescine aminotransferase